MSRTTKFGVSLWLAIPIVAVAGELAMAANHAPVLNASKSPSLTAENRNMGAPSGEMGTLVSTLVDFTVPAGRMDNVTDLDTGAKLGIAVQAASTTSGSWWYSINNGTSWSTLGAVTAKKSRLLAADANTRIYFQPNANYFGTLAGAITFRAWDQTSGSNGGSVNTSNNGGTTPFSTATDTASLLVHAFAVKYRILRDPSGGLGVGDINDNLIAVGQVQIDIPGGFERHAVFARVQPEAPEPIQTTFLEDLVQMPEGWAYLAGAGHINNAGLVIGAFFRPNGSRAHFVCDVSGGVPPYPIQELVLPGTAFQGFSGLMGLNESGDILLSFYSDDFDGALRNAVAFRQTDGTYEFVYLPADMLNCLEMDGSRGSLNDATLEHEVEVAGSLASGQGVVYELTLINNVKAFLPIRTFAKENLNGLGSTYINDDQTVAYQGRYYYGDTGFYTAAASYSVENGAAQPVSAISGSAATHINSAGQIAGIFPRWRQFIYDPVVNYSWRLDDLVYFDNPDDAALWFSTTNRSISRMSNPLPGTGYPALVGTVSGTMGAYGFVALPEPPDTP